MNFRLILILMSLFIAMGQDCLAMNKRSWDQLHELDQQFLEYTEEDNLDLDVNPESEKAQGLPPSKKQAIPANQQASSYSNIAIIPPSAVALKEKTIEEQPLKKQPRSKKLECPFGCPSSQTFNQEALAAHIIATHPGKQSFPCLE